MAKIIETNTLKKAKEEGIVIGKDEGIRIGIEKTAINMLKQNLDDSLISSVAGLSTEQLLKFKSKM